MAACVRVTVKESDGLTPELLQAIDELADGLHLTREQMLVKCAKDKLERLGIVWWQTMLEMNTPKDLES